MFCLKCKYAKWHKTKTGRLSPYGTGECEFPYKIPPLPASKYWISKPEPYGGSISRKTKLKIDCPYYEEEPVKCNEAVKQIIAVPLTWGDAPLDKAKARRAAIKKARGK